MKILIIKTSSLGDIIHVFPVIAYLRQRFPSCSIDWVVEKPFAELVRTHPDISNVIVVNTKVWRKGWFTKENRGEIAVFRKKIKEQYYDVIFDLQGNFKSGLITSQARSKVKVGLGWKTVPERPNLVFTTHRYNPPPGYNIRYDYLSVVKQHVGDIATESSEIKEIGTVLKISSEQEKTIQQILQASSLTNKQIIMICPGSAWPNKQLSNECLKKFLFLISQVGNYAFLFVWGSDSERLLAEELHGDFLSNSVISPRLPLSVLQNVMGKVDLVIAMDSLPLHLAGTTKTPTFSVFGASLAEKYRPLGEQHYTYQGICPYGKTFTKRCPALRTCATGACIRGLTADEVFAHFRTSFLSIGTKNH